MNEHEAKLISMRYFNLATHYAGTIAKINEAARGIKNSQSDTAVIDWLNQAFLKNPPPLGVGSVKRGGVCMKIEYQCSNCGKREKTSAMVGIPHGMFALGYRAVGDALYCPDCVNSWAERNGKPFDEQYKDVGHMFAVWWNATVLKKAKAEHKQLKKYGVNEIGWYEDRGEVAE